MARRDVERERADLIGLRADAYKMAIVLRTAAWMGVLAKADLSREVSEEEQLGAWARYQTDPQYAREVEETLGPAKLATYIRAMQKLQKERGSGNQISNATGPVQTADQGAGAAY